MTRPLTFLLVCAMILVAQGSHGDLPAKNANAAGSGLPVGVWNVEFTNGVKEECDIFNFDGVQYMTVEEPRRRSRGTAEVDGGSFVILWKPELDSTAVW